MNAMTAREKAGCALMGVSYPIMGIPGLAIHVWTIVIAFTASGLFAAMLSFVFPVIAQLYWGFAIWHATGTLANPYCLALIAYVGMWVLMFLGMAMMERS